ncbi:MAG: enoyl-CoA hydratase/isomerase family protein [Rubritepida sp.]|jgi:enoyl-CoA hydratase|nr:enoyl-CoA hydratase/isomerase family protein [Rubritepida sp.]
MSHLLRAYEHGILRVTVDRRERRNALARETLRELRVVFENHARQPDLRLAVISGAGEDAFCAGGDLVDLADTRDANAAERFASEGTAALDAIRLFPVPTIAALNGLAIGGGAELAVACDMRIASHTARIGFVQANLHISTAWGGGADLTRLVGYGRALELLATGTVLDAEDARAIGLVNRVGEEGAFVEFVERFLDPMRSRRPEVMRALKAQALAERLGVAPPVRREGDQARFVETWVDPAHWAVADAFTRKG